MEGDGCDAGARDERPRLRNVEVAPAESDGQAFLVLRDPLGFLEDTVVVSAETAFILSLLDGQRTRAQVQEEFSARFNEVLFSDLLDGILRQLDERLLLDNRRFAEHREKRTREFALQQVRPAAHSGEGRAYPDDPIALAEFLARMFASLAAPIEEGSGAAPASLRALLVPHIDPRRGAASYVRAYTRLRGSSARRFVVLGVSHAPMDGIVALTRKDFSTPLGTLTTDRDFVDRLARRLPCDPFRAEWNHKQEHSVEFQVVMLQWLFRDGGPGLVPILCGYPEEAIDKGGSLATEPGYAEVVSALGETIAESEGETVLVGAVDLSHVGLQYGDREAACAETLLEVERADRDLLVPIAGLDPEASFRLIARDRNRRRVCGVGAIDLLLRCAGPARAAGGELLDYSQWSDGGSAISFAAVAFPR